MHVYIYKMNVRHEIIFKTKMYKSPKQVIKNPTRKERGKKSRETYMKKLKWEILKKQLSTCSATDNVTPSMGSSKPFASSSTNNYTTSSSNTYIYGDGIFAVLTIGGLCAFCI